MSAGTIRRVHAWEALDSRGRPTVGCVVELADGTSGRAIVPSGASRGAHEAVELRDGGDRYAGFGVLGAVRSVNEVLGPLVTGRAAADRADLDATLEQADGEPGLARYGANAALAVSLAVTIANAESQQVPLWSTLGGSGAPLIPMPMVNILSGGAHAGHAIDVQDFLAVPVGANSFAEAIEWISRVRAQCARILDERGGWSALVADEGGLSARLGSNEAALEVLTDGIEQAGFDPHSQMSIAIDVAASQLVTAGGIQLSEEGQLLSVPAWIERVETWYRRYPIVSVEDVVGEDDWSGWAEATRRLKGVQLLGDDLFVTDPERLERGARDGVANAVLVKVNQSGTVSRAERVIKLARTKGYATVVSARSGDTEDTWLADFAVGWRAGQIKVGSTMRSERTAKWNRLLEIESLGNSEFASRHVIAGNDARPVVRTTSN